ncbi:BCCT family transporter [Alcanivorax quisquiliarum]|uniref:BCCT family transporter n=1 Tax=Alcanivorax quisquiliarum TaxID=2933565 RepID=A0ABT0E726_9GAMM|nr:BCCT family transporter [Alcanivorax quisquiliarum]MCK0537619.1 BCCT family transporter [Alcanivorax quisquiliarum]
MSASQRVYVISAAIIIALVIAGAAWPDHFADVAGILHHRISQFFGWFYLLAVFAFIVFLLFLAFGRYGKTRLGPQDGTPDYDFFSWLSMLLSAGFGVGLVFYGMAEPMLHYLKPPHGLAEPGTPEAAELALQYSFFHWGVNQWAAFSLVGLIIAFFQFRKGRPGLVSNMVEPMMTKVKRPQPLLDGLNVLAVVATVMGIATSLGLGVLQMNGGLATVFGWSDSFGSKLIILAAMFIVYTASSSSGLDRGIRWLSNLNIGFAILMMLYLLMTGPTLYILDGFINGMGAYIGNFVQMSLTIPPDDESGWMNDFTLFYWAWVIAWSPYVGTFIARISRGRTIQEFVFGVLIVPPLFACVWIAVFGGYALHLETTGLAQLANTVAEDVPSGLFAMFDVLPGSLLLSGLSLLLIFVFLVTSVDSATYIVAQMTDDGSLNPPLHKRLTWGVLISAICITLIAASGLQGLQSASLLVALPFTFVLFLIMLVLLRELAEDRRQLLLDLYHRNDSTPVGADIFEADEISELNVEERIRRRMKVTNPRLK